MVVRDKILQHGVSHLWSSASALPYHPLKPVISVVVHPGTLSLQPCPPLSSCAYSLDPRPSSDTFSQLRLLTRLSAWEGAVRNSESRLEKYSYREKEDGRGDIVSHPRI